MLNLISTTKLQAVLAAAVAANELPIVVGLHNKAGSSYGPSMVTDQPSPQISLTTGATPVDIASAPSSVAGVTTLNQVETIDVYNKDTSPATVTIQMLSGTSFGTTSILIQRTLMPGETLHYESGYGWQVVSNSNYTGRITTLAAAGTAFGTFTTAKTILPAANVFTLPANFWAVGKQMLIEGVLGLSNIVTTPGTFVLQVKVGSVIAFTTGNIQLNATAHTLLPLYFRFLMTCRAVGAGTSANFMGTGHVQGIHPTLTAGQTDGANYSGIYSAPATAPTVGTGFDSTAAQAIDLWGGFSISDAGNVMQIQQYSVDIRG